MPRSLAAAALFAKTVLRVVHALRDRVGQDAVPSCDGGGTTACMRGGG